MDVSLDADGNIDRGSGFYGACGALSASGVGKKEKTYETKCLIRLIGFMIITL